MSGPSLDKRSFYSQPHVSDSYEWQRFGGASGARVHAREVGLVLDLLPPTGRVLDLACGTGRVARAIAARDQPVVGLDYSAPMAAKAAALAVPTVIGDSFAVPFLDSSFDAVISIRFAFHYVEITPLLREMKRVARPGAVLVFDTYNWTPRARMAVGAHSWGGRVHVHAPLVVETAARTLGLRVEQQKPCFLFSPYLYRLAPFGVARALESIERYVPVRWLCRVFWKLTVA